MTHYTYWSHCRGHKVYSVDQTITWRYSDGKVCDDTRRCPECHLSHELDGPDACLGWIDGMKFVCCTHGGRNESQYVPTLRLKSGNDPIN